MDKKNKKNLKPTPKPKPKDEELEEESPEDDGFCTVGKGSKDLKPSTESTKDNGKGKALTLGQRGALRRVHLLTDKEFKAWSNKEQGWIDSSQAVNDINDSSDHYFIVFLGFIFTEFT